MPEFRTDILVLEDDPTLRLAMLDFFKKSGLVAYGTSKTVDALDLLRTKPVGTVFIDCLMPEQSGVEWMQGIRREFGPDRLEVIFMSGIFKDPGFIKESMESVHARHFLKKPFDLNDLLNFVERPEQTVVVQPSENSLNSRSLYGWIAKDNLTLREKRKALESVEESHGFDLPFIYNFIVKSKMSGHLNVIGSGGEVSGITFSDGTITRVDIADKSTHLGRLILEKGWAHPDDLQRVADEKSNIKFGERLIQGYAVSPHWVQMALSYQMTLRLSKTIVDQPVKINFAQAETSLDTPNI